MDVETMTLKPTPGQIAYAAWHGRPLPADDEWPADDRIVKKWESAAAAVVAAERERCATLCDAIGWGKCAVLIRAVKSAGAWLAPAER